MTVNTQNITSGPYAGDGVNNIFSYTFRIDEPSELAVYKGAAGAVPTLLSLGADYIVTTVGAPNGGLIELVAGPLPIGSTLYIRADYSLNQLTAFASQGGFFPAVHEYALDKLTFIVQQLHEVIHTRGVRLSVADPDNVDGDLIVPTRDVRAGKSLIFNPDGSLGVSVDDYINQAANAMAAAAEALASLNSTTTIAADTITALNTISQSVAGSASSALTSQQQADVSKVDAQQALADMITALNAIGNPLVQADIGTTVAPLVGTKVPNLNLPATALTQDIPLSQKGVAGGVAKLDASGFSIHGHRQQATIVVSDFNLLKDDFEGYVSSVPTGLNKPASAANGYLKVRKLSAIEAVQELTCQTLGTVFMRNLSGGVWGKWSNTWYSPATMYNGYVGYAPPYNGPQYMKDNNGTVFLRGLVNASIALQNAATGAYVFLLPSGYRPPLGSTIVLLGDISTTIARVDIEDTGKILQRASGITWLSFNGMSFSTL